MRSFVTIFDRDREEISFVKSNKEADYYIDADVIITGENGEDIKLLSLTSKKVFPYSTECSNTEQYKGIYKKFKQAKGHNHREPLLVVKKNRQPALAVITLDHFFELIERDD